MVFGASLLKWRQYRPITQLCYDLFIYEETSEKYDNILILSRNCPFKKSLALCYYGMC